jgi:hypothetical protein
MLQSRRVTCWPGGEAATPNQQCYCREHNSHHYDGCRVPCGYVSIASLAALLLRCAVALLHSPPLALRSTLWACKNKA